MQRENVESVYPTTHMQQAMLFHTLYAPDSGVYLVETSGIIDDLDVEAFRGAWQHVIDDTPMLRTAFVWKRIEEAKQVVLRKGVVNVPLRLEEWRELDPEKLAERKQEFILADRARGFDVSNAPLMRLALCRISAASYWFLWTIHHLLVDGWSRRCLMNDLFAAYARIVAGEPPVSSQRPPFSTYVAWLEQQDIESARGCWRNELGGYRGVSGLGVDRSADAKYGQKGSYDEIQSTVPADLTRELRDFARRNGITVNTIFQGALAILLARYIGRSDIVFGGVSSGRGAPIRDVERMVGLLINTIPVRANLIEDQPLARWLSELQQRQGRLRQFDYLPVEEMQKLSEVPSGLPLYESVLVFENLPHVDIPDHLRSPIRNLEGGHRINFPLAVVVFPTDAITVTLAYDRRRFSEAAIRRMDGDLFRILRGMLRPGAKLCDIQVAKEADAVAMTGPALAVPEGTLVDVAWRRAKDEPDRLAVLEQGKRGDWTYGWLVQAAEAIAGALAATGIERGDRVAVEASRSHLLVAGFLGVLRAGATFVAMAPEWPAARKDFVLRDAGARCVLVHGANHAYGERQLDLETCMMAPPEPARLAAAPGSADAAYIIYTSGSTGAPKGVLLRHGALLHSARELVRIMELGSSSRIGQLSSVAFDGCIADMAVAIFAGGCLCVVPQDATCSASAFRNVMNALRVNAIMLPPSYLSAVDAETLPHLRTIVACGEPLSRHVVSVWQPGRVLLNGYGPTELTICTTLGACDASDSLEPALGTPVSNTSIYLMNTGLGPVVPESAGEIHIAGPGEAFGYWERPDLTAERFIPNPFGPPGSRMYRSGDIGRLREGGRLEFVGRVDQQVKIRGFRVELGEIEHMLKRLEGVKEAVVVAVSSAAESVLTAFFETDVPPDVSRIRAALADLLPEPMVPRRFIARESWPRTPSGKLDRRALIVEATPKTIEADDEGTPPSDDLEKLRAIWRRILGRAELGDDDDFFDAAGGDSLSAVRMVSQVEKTFRVEIPVKEVFRKPTIRGLASLIRGIVDATPGTDDAWRDDSRLDANLRPKSVDAPFVARQILLTGANGFVGAWTLKCILEQTDVRVTCLLRSANDVAATEKLRECLTHANYIGPNAMQRCSVLVGDLALPRLGLSSQDWDELAHLTDCVIHLGAWVNYLHPYARLRNVNVHGTRELIRLACEGIPKRFIHGSTLGMFHRRGIVLESDPPPEEASEATHKGYTLTKVVAERLVWQAIQRGLSGAICRMVDVVGDTVTGRSNARDLLFMTFASCMRLGVAPDVAYSFDAVPVDYVANTIVNAAVSREPVGPCLHLSNEHRIDLDGMVEAAAQEGYSIRRIPTTEWMATLASSNADYAHLYALWQSSGMSAEVLRRYDCSAARALLPDTDNAPPRFDQALLRRYVRAAAAGEP